MLYKDWPKVWSGGKHSIVTVLITRTLNLRLISVIRTSAKKVISPTLDLYCGILRLFSFLSIQLVETSRLQQGVYLRQKYKVSIFDKIYMASVRVCTIVCSLRVHKRCIRQKSLFYVYIDYPKTDFTSGLFPEMFNTGFILLLHQYVYTCTIYFQQDK